MCTWLIGNQVIAANLQFPEFGKLRQENHEFKAILGYMVISCFREKGGRKGRRRKEDQTLTKGKVNK